MHKIDAVHMRKCISQIDAEAADVGGHCGGGDPGPGCGCIFSLHPSAAI